jgi:uncharacterized membrane protein (UPF0182 family)
MTAEVTTEVAVVPEPTSRLGTEPVIGSRPTSNSIYNKEDIREVAHTLSGQSGQPESMQPTYVVASLPGEKEPEFLLILPFTPRGKDNLIGWMAARCDGDRLGDLVYFQLSKQQLMYGPMQIESRIDQDQNISKDLTLWNQQGSHVLRGNIMLCLSVADSSTSSHLHPGRRSPYDAAQKGRTGHG